MQRIEIQEALEFLKAGEVVGIPTETVYGLAGNALNEKAVQKIFKAKNRPANNPLIVHFLALKDISSFVKALPKDFMKLYNAFCPGPLTFLLPASEQVSNILRAGSPRVAIRFPKHPICRAILEQCDFPLAAPSANPSGYISPSSAQHVIKQLGDKISGVVDGGNCENGIESTIIGWDADENIWIYRQGSITPEDIQKVIHKKVQVLPAKSKKIEAPGMLSSHYSPKTPSYLYKKWSEVPQELWNKKVGIIYLMPQAAEKSVDKTITLSKDGNLKTIAQNLYSAMHEMDESDIEVILIEQASNEGIGKAINDRLQRACKTF